MTIDHKKLTRLIRQHPDWTMHRLGLHFSVTREAIRQALVRYDLAYKRKTHPSEAVRYRCAHCRTRVNTTTAGMWGRKLRHLCSACALGRGVYCRAGHKNPPRNKHGDCVECTRENLARIARYRVCPGCNERIAVKLAYDRRIRYGFTPEPRLCRQCYYRRGSLKP